MAAGMDEFLAKPFQQDQLIDALERCQPTPLEHRASSTVAPAAPPGDRTLSILVVEDNETNQRVTRLMLRRLGHRCTIAGNGQEALEAMSAADFDLVLMDCHMPVLDGYEATQRMRQTPRGRAVPIIALTAQGSAGARERCLEVGMDGYLLKPISSETLAEELERVLERRIGERTPCAGAEEPSGPGPGPMFEQLESVYGDDPALAAELIALFHADARRLLDGIDAAQRASDLATVARLGHELCGSSGSVGATQVSTLARELERAARALDSQAVARGITELRHAMDEIRRTSAGR